MENISFFWIFLIIVTFGFGAILYLLITHDGSSEKRINMTNEKDEIKISPSAGINPLKGLTERQRNILQYVAEKKEARPPELRQIAGNVSERTVRRDMNVLVARGLVVQNGSTKSTYYKYIGK